MSNTLLITSVGSRCGTNILLALGDLRAHLTVVGLNSDPQAPGLYGCDVAYRVPRTCERAAYGRALRTILERHRPTVVLAGRDEELTVLAALRDDRTWTGTAILTPSAPVAGIVGDRLETYRFAIAQGLPCMPTAATQAGAQALSKTYGYPLICKLRFGGHASKGVWIAHTDAQVAASLDATPCVVQPLLRGHEEADPVPAAAHAQLGTPLSLSWRQIKVCAEGVIDRDGRLAGALTWRARESAGVIQGIVATETPALSEGFAHWAEALAGLGLRGPINLQGALDAEGRFLPWEVNARLTGSILARTVLGAPLARDAVRHWMYGAAMPTRYRLSDSRIVTRAVVDLAVAAADVQALETRGIWHRPEPGVGPLASGPFWPPDPAEPAGP